MFKKLVKFSMTSDRTNFVCTILSSNSDDTVEQLNDLKDDIAADIRTQAVVISGEIQSQTGNLISKYIVFIYVCVIVKTPIYLSIK